MGICQIKKDIEALHIPPPEDLEGKEIPSGERLVGHNLAIEKALKVLDQECPHLKIQYTGWYVLVRKKEDGSWEPVRCVEHFDEDWDGEDKFDVILPIPKPESVPEWDGF